MLHHWISVWVWFCYRYLGSVNVVAVVYVVDFSIVNSVARGN